MTARKKKNAPAENAAPENPAPSSPAPENNEPEGNEPENDEPRAKTRRERLDPSARQRQASDPLSSVWVTASAGTGKTKVLTDRVLRLMLAGARPDQILSITFTRAGASVMKMRIREELGVWASCDDETLVKKLTKLQGRKPDDETIRRARRLFTAVTDSDVGIRIQTIHSFTQDILRTFSAEADLPPDPELMDDQTAAEMLREVLADILRETHNNPDTKLARAARTLSYEINGEEFDHLLGEIIYRRGELISIFDKHGGLEQTIAAVYDWLGADPAVDGHQLFEAMNSDRGISGHDAPDIAGLKYAADQLAGGTPAELEKAKILKAWLLYPEQRAEIFSAYAKVFLTNEGTLRKRLTTAATAHVEDILALEGERLIAGMEAVATANVARGTESLLRFSDETLKRYGARKRAANLLDYDDLIWRAKLLLEKENGAGWVLHKIPGNLKHILVDEAQDTNPDQWAVVAAIVRELFPAGKKRGKVTDRSLFVVGDEKQSIFSFQRADPEEFGRRKKFFAELVRQGGGKWREVDMEIAFRSSPGVTEAVDAVFADPETADGLFFKGEAADKKVHHNPYRRGQAGLVEIHPLLVGEKQDDPEPWTVPVERKTAEDTAARLAERIADRIKGWLDSGEMLESRKRPISPADIMILVRRRTEFIDHLVRELKKRDVPVSGADRMSLRDPIVVQDLLALGDVLLYRGQDLKLASILKAPFIGMTEQQVEDLCIGRGGTVWDALAQKAEDPKAAKIYKAAFDYLSGLAAELNAERPYEFYSHVLTRPCPASTSGLYAFYSRLGFEAEDPLVEFLNAIERYEKTHMAPNLQGFLSWLDAGEAEVKRETALNPDQPRVTIMTVHGSKGLEAPIVFLPDTTGIPEDNTAARPRFLWPYDGRDVPLWCPRSDLENSTFTAERDKVEIERDREYRRLLYVAMTRAADRLYVYGATKADRLRGKSWYARIFAGMAAHLPLQEIDPETGAVRGAFNAAANDNRAEDETPPALRYSVAQTARAVPDNIKPVEKKRAAGVPAWARSAPKQDEARVEKFRPSTAATDAAAAAFVAPSPLKAEKEGYAITLGTVIHHLFEFLPSLPADKREDAARKYLARPVWNLRAADQETTVKNVLAIMNGADFGVIFGENSRPEVSLGGIFEQNGQKKMMSGQIDRLVVDHKKKTVTIVDFKNSRRVPATANEVYEKYVVQMASYRLALQQIYKGYRVRCALLYTRAAKMIPLHGCRLTAALKKIGLKPAGATPPVTPPPSV